MGPEQPAQDSGAQDQAGGGRGASGCVLWRNHRGRLLAVIVTERRDYLRVITAYGLDAGQRRDYLQRRTQGE